MNVKRFLKVGAIGIILMVAVWILVASVHAESNLWMLEISENTAACYNQLCVVGEKGHLYSLAAWVPSPMHKERLHAKGIEVEDYATMYEQKSWEEVVACTEAPVPVVTDDSQIVHYYFGEESIVSFKEASFDGYTEDGHKEYSIDVSKESVFTALLGPEGYGVYDLSSLEDGLYYVNPGGLVELKRSK